jgi:hypothetical protein
MLNKSYRELSLSENDQIPIKNKIDKNFTDQVDSDLIKQLFVNGNQNYNNFQNLPEFMISQNKLPYQINSLELNEELVNCNNLVGIPNFNLYYVNKDGLKIPFSSNKYIVKPYKKEDFPDED